MIVVDASALVDLILQGKRGSRLAARVAQDALALHAPDLVVLEVVQVLRKLQASGSLTRERAQAAYVALQQLRLRRHQHAPLLHRIWSLRDNLTAYDAAYVALAESLEAPLVTLDARLAKASGHLARVQLLS